MKWDENSIAVCQSPVAETNSDVVDMQRRVVLSIGHSH
jgi:hypothetical protein